MLIFPILLTLTPNRRFETAEGAPGRRAGRRDLVVQRRANVPDDVHLRARHHVIPRVRGLGVRG